MLSISLSVYLTVMQVLKPEVRWQVLEPIRRMEGARRLGEPVRFGAMIHAVDDVDLCRNGHFGRSYCLH